MRNFGFKGYDNVVSAGINAKMPEISAAMGLCCLEAMEDFVAVNRRNYLLYAWHLRGLPGVNLLAYDDTRQGNYQYVVIEVDPDVCPRNRNEIVNALHAGNVIARKYFWPGCHRMEPYCSARPDDDERLPQTARVAEKVIVLPTGQRIGEDEIVRVCRILHKALR